MSPLKSRMASYLLLLLLALYGVSVTKSQLLRECYNCNVKMFSQCLFTQSQTSVCPDNSYQCGSVTVTLGTETVFTKKSCIEQAECNKTTTMAGALRMFSYNTTCCTSNYCNSGFSVRGPHLAIMGTVATSILFLTY